MCIAFIRERIIAYSINCRLNVTTLNFVSEFKRIPLPIIGPCDFTMTYSLLFFNIFIVATSNFAFCRIDDPPSLLSASNKFNVFVQVYSTRVFTCCTMSIPKKSQNQNFNNK